MFALRRKGMVSFMIKRNFKSLSVLVSLTVFFTTFNLPCIAYEGISKTFEQNFILANDVSNYEAVSTPAVIAEKTKALSWCAGEGVKITSANSELQQSKNMFGSQIFARAELNAPLLIGETTHIILYVDIPSGNTLLPSIGIKDTLGLGYDPGLSLAVGDIYQYSEIGSDEWSSAAAVPSRYNDEIPDNEWDGAICFDDGFKGYIKIDVSKLTNDDYRVRELDYSKQHISRFVTYFEAIGGEKGSIVVGPYFMVSQDSESTTVLTPEIEAIPFENYNVKRSGGFGNKVYPIDGMNLSGESFDRYLDWNVPKNEFTSVSSCSLQFLNVNQSMTNTEGFMFYLSVPKKTTVTFVLVLNEPDDISRWNLSYAPSLMPLAEKDYLFIADGDTEWQSARLEITNDNGSPYRAGISFESDFSGFIKVPYTSLGNDSGFVLKESEDSLNSLVFYFDRFGGTYGEVIAGPNFFVANDGINDEIILINDYIHHNVNAAYQIMSYKINKGIGIDKMEIDATVNKELGIKGVKIDNEALFEFEENAQVGPQYINSVKLYYENEILRGTDGLLLYIKIPEANLMVLDAVLKRPNDDRWQWSYEPEISLYEGQKCYVLPANGEEWEEKSVVRASSNSYKGGIEFDTAFEGYIKIPYSSLKNDSGLVFSPAEDALNTLKIRFKRMGGSYGEIYISDCFLLKKSTQSPCVDINVSGEIIVDDINGGFVEVNKRFATAGEKIAVKVTPETGYALKASGLYITYINLSGVCRQEVFKYDADSDTFFFKMPVSQRVTLSAEFIPDNEQNFALYCQPNNNSFEFIFRELENSYASSAKGILITIEETLGTKELSIDTKGADIINAVFSEADYSFELGEGKSYLDYIFRLKNIKSENLGRNFVARGYSVIDGKYFYTPAITVNYSELTADFSDYKSFPDVNMNPSEDSYYEMICNYVDSPFNEAVFTGGIKTETNGVCDNTIRNVQDSPYWFRINFEPVIISEFNSLGIYFKVPASKENSVYIDLKSSDGGNFKLTAGHEYLLMNKVTGENEYRTTAEGSDKYHGVIILPPGFEGFVCLPFSAFNPRNYIVSETELISITFRFGFIGKNENSVTAGPLVGIRQTERIVNESEILANVEVPSSSLNINTNFTEMINDSALFYWDNCNGAENYLLKVYEKVIGGYSCISEKIYNSDSGAVDRLKKGEKYLLKLCARNKHDEIIAEYATTEFLFEPSDDFNDIEKEEIIYDTVDYSSGNSPFVKRSYTTLNAYNSRLLNDNPNRGLRGCIDFFHFNLTENEIKVKLDSYINGLKSNGVNGSVHVCYLYPGDYIAGNLEQEFFDCVQRIFDYFRTNRIQILLRFAYYDVNNFNQRTPTTGEILRHITQLSENGIIERNKDVLHAFQVGFIGKYGEWHSDTPAEMSADRSIVLNAFVEKLLPEGVYAQLRMPDYKNFLLPQNMLEYGNRFGFHLDSFFGIMDGTEIGSGQYSYGYPEWDRHIREAYCAPNDAETYYWQQFDDLETYPEGYGSAIAASQLRLTTLSAINGYLDQNINAPGCINNWKKLPVTEYWLRYNKLPVTEGWLSDNGCNKVNRNIFEYIRDYLGYRISAKELSVSDSQKGMIVSLDLVNYGFAAAFNISSRMVILDSQNKEVAFAEIGNPDEWYGTLAGDIPDGELLVYNIEADFEIPVQSGDYKIALQLESKSGACARLDNNIPYENGYNILHTFKVN